MTFYCLFYQFIVGKFSGPMAMLDNFIGHVGRSRIAGSVDSATGMATMASMDRYWCQWIAIGANVPPLSPLAPLASDGDFECGIAIYCRH